ANAVRIGRIIAANGLLENAGLDLLVGGRAEGLGDVERDLAGSERFDDDGRQAGEAQTALDEADRETEAARDILDRSSSLDERRKSERLVGRVQRETVKVFREAGFDSCFGVVFENEAGDFVTARQNLVVDQGEHGATAAFASLDLELALGGR